MACNKDEVNPKTLVALGWSRYGEAQGWIDGCVDRYYSVDILHGAHAVMMDPKIAEGAEAIPVAHLDLRFEG